MNTRMESLTSGLDQLVQASLLHAEFYEQQSPRHNLICNKKELSPLSYRDISMVTATKFFDKQQAYQARFCESTRDSCCPHYALHGFRFCVKHILEDPSAPYKQCDYLEGCTQSKCTLPVSVSVLDTRFCQLHKFRTSFGDSIGLQFLNRVFELGTFCSAVMTVAVAHELTGEMYALIDDFCMSTNQDLTSVSLTEVTRHGCQGADLIAGGLKSHLKPNLENLCDAIAERICPSSISTTDDADSIAVNLATRECLKNNEMPASLDVEPLNSTQMSHMWTSLKWQDSLRGGNESTFVKLETMPMDTEATDATMELMDASDRCFKSDDRGNRKHKELAEVWSHGKRLCVSNSLGVRKRPWGAYGAKIRTPEGKGLWLGTSPSKEEAAYAYDVAARTCRGKSGVTNFGESREKNDLSHSEFMALNSRSSIGKVKEENSFEETKNCEKCEAEVMSEAEISFNTSKQMPDSLRNQYYDSSTPCGLNMAAEIDGVSDQKVEDVLEETSVCLSSGLEGHLQLTRNKQKDASKVSLMYLKEDLKEDSHEDDIKNMQSKAVAKQHHTLGLECHSDFTQREKEDATKVSLMHSREDTTVNDPQDAIKNVQSKAVVKQYHMRAKKKFRSLSSSTATGIEVEPEHGHGVEIETQTSVDGYKAKGSDGEESSDANNRERKRKRRAMNDPHLRRSEDVAINIPRLKDDCLGVLGSSKNEDDASSKMSYDKEEQSDDTRTREIEDCSTECMEAVTGKLVEGRVTRRSQKFVQPSTTAKARRRNTLYGFNSDYYIESEYSRVYKTTSRQRALVRYQ